MNRFRGRHAPDPVERARTDPAREPRHLALVAMAASQTLAEHGLPATCIETDALPAATPAGGVGTHVLLVFREWHPALLAYTVALQRAVRERMEQLDPLASTWLTDISWRFEPRDGAQWPRLPRRSGGVPVAAAYGPAGSSRAALLQALGRGDAAYAASRVPPDDFTPTVPMPMR